MSLFSSSDQHPLSIWPDEQDGNNEKNEEHVGNRIRETVTQINSKDTGAVHLLFKLRQFGLSSPTSISFIKQQRGFGLIQAERMKTTAETQIHLN